MSQSRTGSFIEACANIAIGMGVALISQLVIFPMYGIHIPFNSNVQITAWFTFVSLVRSYWIRRWFNNFKGLFQ